VSEKEKKDNKETELIDHSVHLEKFDEDFRNFDQKEFDKILERCMRNDVEKNYLKKNRIES
tara:strand:- start:234 stop:416 length:183 start_codon:yes stop_codon:yes gene_type:complete